MGQQRRKRVRVYVRELEGAGTLERKCRLEASGREADRQAGRTDREGAETETERTVWRESRRRTSRKTSKTPRRRGAEKPKFKLRMETF